MRLMGKISGLLLAMFANVVVASEATHGGINWWHLGPSYKEAPALGWLTITFVIFVVGVSRAVKKPLSLYLETRSKDIKRQIEEGRLAKIESEKRLRLYDEKLNSLGQEIEKMKQNFLAQANAEKEQRKRQAEETEARILRDTEDTIRANIERSRNRLAEEVIARAMKQAEATIAEQKRDAIDELLKDSFIKDLRVSAAEAKRDYVVNEFVKGSLRNDAGAAAREVH